VRHLADQLGWSRAGGKIAQAIARRILAAAPPRFALAGLSTGGYICFEIVRQAPDRVDRLALLDTSAPPDTPEVTERRQAQIALARGGRFAEIPDQQFPLLIHPSRQGDRAVWELVQLTAEDAGGIPGARLVVVAGSGHLTPLDQPEEVTKALVEWLQA
jgi:pimeloyl-ACP methyl ester carboxylesterase